MNWIFKSRFCIAFSINLIVEIGNYLTLIWLGPYYARDVWNWSFTYENSDSLFHISNLPLRKGSWNWLCTPCAWLNASPGIIAMRMGLELWWYPMSTRVALSLTRFPDFIVGLCLAKNLITLENYLCIAISFKSSSLSLFILKSIVCFTIISCKQTNELG